MNAQGFVDSVKRYLRTENLPYTDTDIALFVGEVLGTLTEGFDLLTSIDLYNTTKGQQSYTLPANFKKALSVYYRPSATATVASYNPTTQIITCSQNVVDRGWDKKGTLILGNQELPYRLVDNAPTQIELLDTPNPVPQSGDGIREKADWIELDDIDPSEAVLVNTKPFGEDKLRKTLTKGFSVAGRTLYIAYPIHKTGTENIRVECIVSHPIVAALTDPVFIPPSWKEVVSLSVAKRVLESWMGEEAGDWIANLNREINTRLQLIGLGSTSLQHRGSSIRRVYDG